MGATHPICHEMNQSCPMELEIGQNRAETLAWSIPGPMGPALPENARNRRRLGQIQVDPGLLLK